MLEEDEQLELRLDDKLLSAEELNELTLVEMVLFPTPPHAVRPLTTKKNVMAWCAIDM